jgi:hypothetical protein
MGIRIFSAGKQQPVFTMGAAARRESGCRFVFWGVTPLRSLPISDDDITIYDPADWPMKGLCMLDSAKLAALGEHYTIEYLQRQGYEAAGGVDLTAGGLRLIRASKFAKNYFFLAKAVAVMADGSMVGSDVVLPAEKRALAVHASKRGAIPMIAVVRVKAGPRNEGDLADIIAFRRI